MNKRQKAEIKNWLCRELKVDRILRIYHTNTSSKKKGQIAYVLGKRDRDFLFFAFSRNGKGSEVWRGRTWSYAGIQQIIFRRQIKLAWKE